MRFNPIQKPVVNDTKFGAQEVLEHRLRIIALRDEALRQDDFEWAVTLSVTIGLLNVLADALVGATGERE